jgi:hypothetical protein
MDAYQHEAAARPVFPTAAAIHGLSQLPDELPQHGMAPEAVLQLLAAHAGPATIHTNSGPYSGFVTGASMANFTAMDITASYLHASGIEPVERGPESSRRARGLAALPTGEDVERSLQLTLRSLPAGV